jgi:NAD(P)H-dependent flavin oxidoreductase YrpB (nitropropane dioxygenase family)
VVVSRKVKLLFTVKKDRDLKKLKIGNLIAKIPIVQGGMGVGISMSSLAVSVANEGGIGVIAAAGIGMMRKTERGLSLKEANISALREEIKIAKKNTKGILGVNIMTALTDFSDIVKASIEEGIDIIFSGAGLPLNLPGFLKVNDKTKLVPIVSSGRAAGLITKRWVEKYNYLPDAFVVEGPKAGGHLGFKRDQLDNKEFSLEKIIKDVLGKLRVFEEKYKRKIPVIAAGGIYEGKDIRKFLELGASGVQMGTRFVTTDECDADIEFKNTYLNCKKDDVVIIDSPVGLPGRAIMNAFINKVKNGEKQPLKCPFHCIRSCNITSSPYCIALALTNAKNGKLHNGFAFAGSNAFRADKIVSVKELFKNLITEYKTSLRRKK